MTSKALLLSIKPRHANKIFDGSKTVELRRVRPRIRAGDLVLVYVSSPVKALLGAFEVDNLVAATPAELWKSVSSAAGLTRAEFDDYFVGAKNAYGIFLKRKWRLDQPVKLEKLREAQANFRAPQSYVYLTPTEAMRIGFDRLFDSMGRTGATKQASSHTGRRRKTAI